MSSAGGTTRAVADAGRAIDELAADLNTLLAAPSLASWRTCVSLHVAAWMEPVGGKTPATVLSVAHLDEEERQLVLGVVLEEVLAWVRRLPGTSRLKALIDRASRKRAPTRAC